MREPVSIENADAVVYDVLSRLGATSNYAGFVYTFYAICLAMENPQRLRLVTKWLYPDVAKACGTNWKTVEHGIRLTIARVWGSAPDFLLDTLHIHTKPSPAKFLAILAAYCSEHVEDLPHFRDL